MAKQPEATHIDLMFPSRFLKAAEFGGRDVTLTIVSVAMDDLQMRSGQKQRKPLVTFRETEKQLVLNKTNAVAIAEVLGSKATKDWAGKRVTLYPTRANFGGEQVDAIRVRRAGGEP